MEQELKLHTGLPVRYLPFENLRELYRKCKELVSVMDDEQKLNRERLDNNLVEYKELSPIGFSVDYNQFRNKDISIESIFKSPANELIEISLKKNGVLTIDELPLNTKLL